MPDMSPLSRTPEWMALAEHARDARTRSMRSLFADDAARFAAFSHKGAGLFADFSKNRITGETLRLLLALARARGVETRRAAMFAGEKINETERRAVLHVALRDRDGAYTVDGEPVAPLVAAELKKMAAFCDAVHRGGCTGWTGKTLDTVVNIGIGGSDLGPLMAVEALEPFWVPSRRTFHVSNVDGAHLARTLDAIDPERTLFIVASKTFTTQETMTNAASARAWLLAQGAAKEDVAKHFVALSTNEAAVKAFGVDPANMFAFWDWVGGRYSMWSAIGLSIALQVGFANFERLLAGAHAMDAHFRTAEMAENLPVLMALIGVWNRNFMGCAAHAVLPYAQGLSRLPAYLQQLEMESNGKRATLSGASADYGTCPVLFGEPGTNGQHAFYQLLHQGTDPVSADFIAAAHADHLMGDHHEKLLANFLAQPEALMRGRTQAEAIAEMREAGLSEAEAARLAPHRAFPGDRPTTSILMERLTPEMLGALVALYEHKVFVEGAIWGINSFDQWGVELGKQLAKPILSELGPVGAARPPARAHDASTNGLIDCINAMRTQG